jgi:hypothetical protein
MIRILDIKKELKGEKNWLADGQRSAFASKQNHSQVRQKISSISVSLSCPSSQNENADNIVLMCSIRKPMICDIT